MTWYDSATMTAFGASALAAVGIPEPAAALTSRSLVVADQRGTHSHGLLRLPLYVSAIEQGGIKTHPDLRWVRQEGATGLLDADAALGQVAMQAAVERAAEVAATCGAAVIAVHGSSHYGAGSFWAEQLTALGMLAMVTSTTGPVVAPYGGSEKIFGTNPLTLAVPALGGESLLADLATSTGAYGKVIAAKNAGEQIPAGWAVGPNGLPTTDPDAAMAGALTPFGGHKGSAVAGALEAFSAVLGQGTFAFETEDIWSNPASRMNIGQLLIVIDPGFFRGRSWTEERTAALLAAIRGSATGSAEALAPGDPERNRAAESGSRVALTESVVAGLAALAERLTLPLPGALPATAA